ncbi:MAG: Txe/YoeB family addiction module toxin [Treponema sp.]|jgi:toxin YoeB|nr:Txe/YoeB family addiction module toxin [Treponema sp.]
MDFAAKTWADQYWIDADKKKLKRINLLIKDIDRNLRGGNGKPDPLKANSNEYWLWKIELEHRVIYAIENEKIVYIFFRFHYDDK